MRRTSIARRLEALEARRPGRWPFRLDDGRMVYVAFDVVLAVFMEGASWMYPTCQDPEVVCDRADCSYHRQPEPSPGMELLARAVSSPDDGALGRGVVEIARAVREQWAIAGGAPR